MRMHSSNATDSCFPSYFYSLDILRGIASLAVVFWHWQHFFFVRGSAVNFNLYEQPLFPIFKHLYLSGWRAVDIFFCLSGFIFFFLYTKKIEDHKMPADKFMFLRFSRLYPLHVFTLFLVIGLQYLFYKNFAYYFVYQNDDIFHFLLQLLMASNWGFEKNFSFNGPIWSVSVEILCYALFYFLSFYRINRFIIILTFVFFLTYLLHKHGESHIYRGLLCFFVGGVYFKFFSAFVRSKIKYNKAVVAVFIALLLWIVVPIIHARGGEFYTAYCSKIGSGYLIFPGKSILGYAAFILSKFSYELILFPWTIITLALLEMYSIKPSKSFAFLGHISYSSYLLHFPLQIIFVLSTSYFLIDRDFFYSPVSLILFFLCLIPLSLLSYKFFESPIQRYLRNLS